MYRAKLGNEQVAVKVFEDESVCKDELGILVNLTNLQNIAQLKVDHIIQITAP